MDFILTFAVIYLYVLVFLADSRIKDLETK